MRKLFLILLSAISMFGCEKNDAITEPVTPSPKGTSTFQFSENEVVKGFMRIKLKVEPTNKIAVRSVDGKTTTGIQALDNLASALHITHIERTFPPAGKFEERTRKEGLHLWYNIRYDETVPTSRAVTNIADLEGIDIATPILKVVSTATAVPAFTSFNDPGLPNQWSFNNPGSETWQQAGADIRLADIWKTYNGHPDIIVSIVDGGIFLEHPDLKANLWTNSGEIPNNGIDDDGNGYIDDVHGYNFVSNNATLTAHRHGTHVAGTIAATNNNGVGVCGIAGGNGSLNSGVKLMSCQILQHPGGNFYQDNVAQDIASAIKYGADNGAVISQNSWGYAADNQQNPSYIDPADKAAIDYFVKYAGCDNDGNQLPGSPMKGGIVIFASGNADSSIPRIAAPADYENVVGVAALRADYKKAYYSNYGSYMDISAPGGEYESIEGIYSTTIVAKNYYEYRSGTSMACPHVSGVAALVIEKYGVGQPGFTPELLKDILYTTAYDVDVYNDSKYAGKLGHGCVDATAALQAVLSEVEDFTIMSNPINNGILSFRVTSSQVGNALLTVFNSTGNRVLSKNISTNKYVATNIDISKLAAGQYTMVYECNQTKIKERFIKY